MVYNQDNKTTKEKTIMAKTVKALNEEIKSRYLSNLIEHLDLCGEEVLRVASNEIALPTVDEDGNEKFVVITVKVPTGSRDGDAYDGYAMRDDYDLKQIEKTEKAKKREADVLIELSAPNDRPFAISCLTMLYEY